MLGLGEGGEVRKGGEEREPERRGWRGMGTIRKT